MSFIGLLAFLGVMQWITGQFDIRIIIPFFIIGLFLDVKESSQRIKELEKRLKKLEQDK
ncbi:hypothetical protein DFP97_117161 [Paenibacillus prosopidis]|uniref:Uncharacterized protein n=2 Tax=Paenibacillus prosopidis TaxID=630520 RepID=A0A368VPD9_9BACL|nr:hypothetical protein DFP97_117161 [Paenibacillus prosopidis]